MSTRRKEHKTRTKIALFLGGGAPNFTLMSGALLALHRKLTRQAADPTLKFDIVSMAGAGAVVGLLYLAPKELTPEQSLENTKNFGISDEIYSLIPINYKAFGKPGLSAELFNDYWFDLPQVQAAMNQYDMTDEEKLWSDWLLLFGSMICPTDLSFYSQGISGHPRFIDALIDFDKLRERKEQMEINAYCIDEETIVDFNNRGGNEITPDHLRAALSFPFIYPPYELDGKHHYEGAAFQAINPVGPHGIHTNDIDAFIILDPMSRFFIQRPRNLWDAYTQSVMMPISALAEFAEESLGGFTSAHLDEDTLDEGEQFFDTLMGKLSETDPRQNVKIPLSTLRPFLKKRTYTASFREKISPERLPSVFDWSRSNLDYLFDIGYQAGEELADRVNRSHSDWEIEKEVRRARMG